MTLVLSDSILKNVNIPGTNFEILAFPGARPTDGRLISAIRGLQPGRYQAVLLFLGANALSEWKGKPALNPETVCYHSFI